MDATMDILAVRDRYNGVDRKIAKLAETRVSMNGGAPAWPPNLRDVAGEFTPISVPGAHPEQRG
jgi:hypothetical protein